MPQDALIQLAKTILNFDWAGGYTRLAPRLYPHQWSWDSALIAIGYVRYELDRAFKELTHLFERQWRSGFLPHKVHEPYLTGEGYTRTDFWAVDPVSRGTRGKRSELKEC